MSKPDVVVVHPLVLLSIVDNYNRVARGTKKRVVGVLLGEKSKGRVDITNSYAVPFEEDEKDQKIWFLDHRYALAERPRCFRGGGGAPRPTACDIRSRRSVTPAVRVEVADAGGSPVVLALPIVQLQRADEQHVQEDQRQGEDRRVVQHGAPHPRGRPGHQRADDVLLPLAHPRHHRRAAQGARDPNQGVRSR
mmetsp:Transcript_32655/g.104076  ORF Transcript_32655/g.104076 Transcript_32655/m.104076 type:complete len:193 (+) Transcript_32655:179-757(+)